MSWDTGENREIIDEDLTIAKVEVSGVRRNIIGLVHYDGEWRSGTGS